MRHYIRVVLIVGLWTTIFASAQASAQQANSFEQLQVLIRPGDTIVVVGTDGTTSKGQIQSLTPASLRLATKGNIREFTQRDAIEIKQRRGDSLGNGAWIGALTGGAVMSSFVIIVCQEEGWWCRGNGGSVAFTIATSTGIGAAIGVGIDALVKHQQTIYRPAGSVLNRVHVAPLMSRDRKGVALKISF